MQAFQREDDGAGQGEHRHRLQHHLIGRTVRFEPVAQQDRGPHREGAGGEIEQRNRHHRQLVPRRGQIA